MSGLHGVRLSACFALPPNSRSYCGKSDFQKKLQNYLAHSGKKEKQALEHSMRSFLAHYSYLQAIASANKLPVFHPKVTEAVWIGNNFLFNVKRQAIEKLILKNFCGPGLLSKKRAEKLAANIPAGVVVHHSFHALYLHTITGVISHTVQNADHCIVHWNKVEKINGNRALVQSQKLVKKDGKLALVPCKRTLKLVCRGLLLTSGLKKGDLVASHWGVAVMKLTRAQAKNLEKFTIINVRALNSMKA